MANGRFGYTAFVIDAFAGLIPGWECSMSKHTTTDLEAVAAVLNSRPRKTLGWKTPAEALNHPVWHQQGSVATTP